MGWVLESFIFRATDTSALLPFASNVSNPYGAALDNVAISAMPLPATWTMLLSDRLGIGCLVIFPRFSGRG